MPLGYSVKQYKAAWNLSSHREPMVVCHDGNSVIRVDFYEYWIHGFSLSNVHDMNGSVNLWFRYIALGIFEKVKIAAIIGLGNMFHIHLRIAAWISFSRLRPGSLPYRHFFR